MNQRAIWLGTLGAAVLLVALLGCAIFLVPHLLYPPLSAVSLRGVTSTQMRVQLQQAQSQLANNIREFGLQGLAGLVVVTGAAATWWQVHISREGQLTERFTRAVDQLGSTNVDIRIGGIYALERIGKNSTADSRAIQFLLGAFVRNHASWPVGAVDGPQHPTVSVDQRLLWMQVRAADIQASMGALGRRPFVRDERVLYLSRVDLRGLQLNGARLTGAQMRHSNLARAWLREVRLDRSDLQDTDLRQAYLEEVRLTGADLRNSYLQDAHLHRCDLTRADLRGANLTGVTFEDTVLAGAKADDTTAWPVNFDTKRRRELRVIETDPNGLTQMPTGTVAPPDPG